MLHGIDISNWQKGFNLADTMPDFVIVKATEGINFVDAYCDGFVQDAIRLNIPWGFYHFARSNDPAAEATYFFNQTRGYVGKGIPILDFEVPNSNEWLETWCKTYYQLSGIYPWVYINADYITNRGYGTDWVKQHCGLWLAGYPQNYAWYPDNTTCPYKHEGWLLAAWQFTSSLSMGGMRVDGDFFYGDTHAWNKYAGINNTPIEQSDDISDIEIWQLARRVINGEFGNGQDRKDALGSNYDAVQTTVNALLQASDTFLAQAVIKGSMGNGQTRKDILGNRYNAVQAQVNDLVN